jgi:hypothetical protein
MLYAVLSGPVLINFARHYYPIALMKATTAAAYITAVWDHNI